MNRGAYSSFLGFASIAIALFGFAFVLHASYPGYLNPDSSVQLEQAIGWRFDDWQSPFPKLLWAVLLKLIPGPVGLIVLNNVLIWGTTLALALAMRRFIGAWSILLVAVPFFPGAFNFLGNAHVDAMLVAWLLAAATSAYISRRENISARMRLVMQILANLLIVTAFLTRPNVIFSLVPLLLYANARLDFRRNLLLCVALIVAMPMLNKIQNKVLEVTPSSVVDSIKVYNLLALSYHERRNLLPGEWTEPQSRDIVNACYSPVQWDAAWTGQCGFIYVELQRQQLWGSSQLTRVWLRETFDHPVVYFSALAATFKTSMFEPNSRAMLYQTPNPWNWQVADNPPRPTTELAQRYILSAFNDQVGRPWVYVVLSALGIVLLFRTRAGATEEGRLALAILTSGLVYLLTYFVFNVSAEYRYFYWCGFATYIGFVVALASVISRRRAARQSEKPDALLRAPTLVIAALAAALVAFPYDLPTEQRIVTITPLGPEPVMVTGVHNAATPKWMGQNFEGRIESTAWVREGTGYRSTRPYSPLVVELETLKQDIDVVVVTGPGMGSATVEGAGFQRRMDTAAAQTGSATVSLPSQAAAMHESLSYSVRNAAMALLFFLAFLAIFWKVGLSSPSRKSDVQCAPNAGSINAGLRAFQLKFVASLLRHRFVRFLIVGGVGFVIEAALLTYFATVPGLGAIKGRAISFPIAVVTTWWLNRTLTFQSKNNPHRESFRYLLVQSLGAVANLGVFMVLVSAFPWLRPVPVVPLFIAAIFGLLVNFALSKKYVFAQHEKQS
ncbi:MAG: GtrA family protein [Thiobacillus sp.]